MISRQKYFTGLKHTRCYQREEQNANSYEPTFEDQPRAIATTAQSVL